MFLLTWCWRRLLRVPWTARRSKPIHSEGDQPWDFFGRNDAKAETPVLWTPRVKGWLIGKDSDAGRDWGQEEKGTTGWDGWMASLTRWTWVWVNSGGWWWTGRCGVLRFMGSQRVGHDWVTEMNWTEHGNMFLIVWGTKMKVKVGKQDSELCRESSKKRTQHALPH